MRLGTAVSTPVQKPLPAAGMPEGTEMTRRLLVDDEGFDPQAEPAGAVKDGVLLIRLPAHGAMVLTPKEN